MKQGRIYWMLGVLILGFAVTAFTQELLPEITVKAMRYKYLTAVGQKDAAAPVKILQQRAAEYDVKSSDFYEEDYDSYFVSFYLPEGQILAAYDQDGKLLSTAEKYNDIALPQAVRTAIAQRFPNWGISHDVYRVNYYESNNRVIKVYKITLQNGDLRQKVKMNEKGEFL